jgi:hypothetical protein
MNVGVHTLVCNKNKLKLELSRPDSKNENE